MPNKSIFAVVARSYASPDVPCPKCDSPMVARNGKNGWFWGCSTYPKCKGSLNVEEVPYCPKCGNKLIKRFRLQLVVSMSCSTCNFTTKVREEDDRSVWHYANEFSNDLYDDWGDQ